MATSLQPNRFNKLGIYREGLEYVIDSGNQDLIAEYFGKEDASKIIIEAHQSFEALPKSFARFSHRECEAANDILRQSLMDLRNIFWLSRRGAIDIILEAHVKYLRAMLN